MIDQTWSQLPPDKQQPTRLCGTIGFYMSVIGLFFALLFMLRGLDSYPEYLVIWILASVLSLSGFVVSFVGLFQRSPQFAIAGVVISPIGVLVSIFIVLIGMNRGECRSKTLSEDSSGVIETDITTKKKFFTNSTLSVEKVSVTDANGLTITKKLTIKDGVVIEELVDTLELIKPL